MFYIHEQAHIMNIDNEIEIQLSKFLPRLNKFIDVLKDNANREYPQPYPLQYLKKQKDREDVSLYYQFRLLP
jgi:hypothetical protein